MQVITPKQLTRLLLNVAPARPVFIWGPPGIGKSALVEKFAGDVGLDCVSLLGSQLAPEDLIGVPQIVDGRSVFCPPRMIARDDPYLLFVDELNACSFEVQKAFYSLINDRRLGEYRLPAGSVVVGAGNRAQDQAIVKPMSSALMNRMLHVELKPTARDWLDWAYAEGVSVPVWSRRGPCPVLLPASWGEQKNARRRGHAPAAGRRHLAARGHRILARANDAGVGVRGAGGKAGGGGVGASAGVIRRGVGNVGGVSRPLVRQRVRPGPGPRSLRLGRRRPSRRRPGHPHDGQRQ